MYTIFVLRELPSYWGPRKVVSFATRTLRKSNSHTHTFSFFFKDPLSLIWLHRPRTTLLYFPPVTCPLDLHCIEVPHHQKPILQQHERDLRLMVRLALTQVGVFLR
ncbi:hypothetical protein E2542_SST30221 [Spatholobus suberectus]|nr:hypothetical protein E2542_SST30221 [Spatholobus suberectus]